MAKPNQELEVERETCDIHYSKHFRRQTLLFSQILQLKYSSFSYQNLVLKMPLFIFSQTLNSHYKRLVFITDGETDLSEFLF